MQRILRPLFSQGLSLDTTVNHGMPASQHVSQPAIRPISKSVGCSRALSVRLFFRNSATARTLAVPAQAWIKEEGDANGLCYHIVSLNCNYSFVRSFDSLSFIVCLPTHL